MTLTDFLMCVGLAFALLAFWGERRRDRLSRRDLEMRLDRYRLAVDDLDRWCGHEIPQARLIAAHLRAVGEGDSLNAGTPAADEPCTVNGLREQLRRLKPTAPTYEQIADLLLDDHRDDDEMHDFARDVVELVLTPAQSTSRPA